MPFFLAFDFLWVPFDTLFRFFTIWGRKWLPEWSRKLYMPSSFWCPRAAPKRFKNASATQPRFFIDFGAHFGGILMILVNFLTLLNRQCRQFLPASCFKCLASTASISRCRRSPCNYNPPTPAGVRRFRREKPASAKRRLRRLALLTSRRPPGESKWHPKSYF